MSELFDLAKDVVDTIEGDDETSHLLIRLKDFEFGANADQVNLMIADVQAVRKTQAAATDRALKMMERYS